jgi:hypothetical protein
MHSEGDRSSELATEVPCWVCAAEPKGRAAPTTPRKTARTMAVCWCAEHQGRKQILRARSLAPVHHLPVAGYSAWPLHVLVLPTCDDELHNDDDVCGRSTNNHLVCCFPHSGCNKPRQRQMCSIYQRLVGGTPSLCPRIRRICKACCGWVSCAFIVVARCC